MNAKDFEKLAAWSRRQPSVGSGKKYVVHCNQEPVAGFDTETGAESARDMYARMQPGTKQSDQAKNRNWWIKK